MKKLLFLTLNTFSATGGIEKVCRAAGKALSDITNEEGNSLAVYSMYDKNADVIENYLPASIFKGYHGNRLRFVTDAVRKGSASDVVILSHINLLLVGFFIKTFSPKTKLILIAHGIEVWAPLAGWKKRMIKSVDLFLPVSRFTGEKLQTVFGVPSQKLQVLNNCLDPFLERRYDPVKETALTKKYGFTKQDQILLTVTRLKFSEQYKGYDKVITALTTLKQTHPHIKYLIAGRYDKEEKDRLDNLIKEAKLEQTVIFAGFVPDEDLAAHFNLADIYIMPSTGEGFGIVFIEAMFYGLPVIAGNKDGSVDALANGELGVLIDPDNQEEIITAVIQIFNHKGSFLPNEKRVIEKFGFTTYKESWHQLLYANRWSSKNISIEASTAWN